MRLVSTKRLSSYLRMLATGVLLALPLACWQVGSRVTLEPNRAELAVGAAVLECPVGAEGCPCTSGGGCDPGLSCIHGYCTASDGYGDEYVYEFEDDLMDAVTLTPPPDYGATAAEVVPMPGRSSGRKGRPAKLEKHKRKEGRDFAIHAPAGSAAPAPEESIVTPKPAPISVTGEGETDDEPITEDESDDARQIIYTADLTVSVYELDASIEFAESLPQRYGGWIESRYDYQITLRLPAERLFEAIDQLSALGLTIGKTLRADDVTDEYTDLESRILVLEELVEQLELLLAKAKTVEEALKIRVELDRVRIELEAARVRMRQLSELIDFSTLTLHLVQRGPVEALPSSNDPFPWVDDLGVETTEYR
jgi:hypothetical protein